MRARRRWTVADDGAQTGTAPFRRLSGFGPIAGQSAIAWVLVDLLAFAAGRRAGGRRHPCDDGYRGIWFALGQMQQYGDKYSGRLATYTANRVPMAIYSNAANKTFFVYGGAKQGKRYLLDMIAYYDHARGVVPRPTIVYDKQATAFAQRRATPWLPKASTTRRSA